MKRKILFLTVFCLVTCTAFGAPEPTTRRGFHPDAVYDYDGLDSVDLYNGNLTVGIPLGQQYQSNGTLSYQFALHYNSNMWDFYEQTNAGFSTWTDGEMLGNVHLMRVKLAPGIVSLHKIGEIMANFNASVSAISGSEAVPAPYNTALGWRMSFGEIYGGLQGGNRLLIQYIDQSGAERVFYGSLHGNGSSYGEYLEGPGPFYARDGSYLRLRRTDIISSAADGVKVEIDSPDGIIRRFSCASCTTNGVAEWRLEEIADPYGNLLVIERGARPGVGQEWNWTYKEIATGVNGYAPPGGGATQPAVRQHTAKFLVKRVFRYTDEDDAARSYDLWTELQLQELRLAGPEGDASALYKFAVNDKKIFRPPQNNWIGTHPIIPNAPDGSITLGTLDWIELPADALGHKARWNFDYYGEGDDISFQANVADVDAEGPARTGIPYSYFSGRLKHVIYPTGGGMRYEYAGRGWIKVSCDPHFGGPLRAGTNQVFLSIFKRQPVDNARQPSGRPWIYTGKKYLLLAPGECDSDFGTVKYQPLDIVTSVIDPAGKAAVTYFQNYIGAPRGGWTEKEYGLPFTRYESDSTDASRFLSSEIYDCSARLAELPDTNLPANEADLRARLQTAEGLVRRSIARHRRAGETGCEGPLRKTYVRFENSGITFDPAEPLGTSIHTNRRLVSSRTVYRDRCSLEGGKPYCRVDPNFERSSTVEYSNFDGLGNYRTVRTGGDFYAGAWPNEPNRDQQTKTTWFNPGVSYNAAALTMTPSDVLTDPTRLWYLGTYDWIKTSWQDDAQRTEFAQYRFACATNHTLCSSNGFLLGWRRIRKFCEVNAPANSPTSVPCAADTHTGPPTTVPFSNDDVMMRRTREYDTSVGQPQPVKLTEYYFGGTVKKGLVPNSSSAERGSLYADMPAASTAEYAIRKTLNFGMAAKTEYLCCSGTTSLVTEQNVVDRGTGLVTQSRDAWGLRAAGVPSTFAYDALGRLKSTRLPGEAEVTYAYPNFSTGGPPWRVTATQNGGAAGTRTTSYLYDAFGRLVTTERSIKNEVGKVRREYSEDRGVGDHLLKGESNEGNGNRFSEYTRDIFGRVLKTVVPQAVGDSDLDSNRNVHVTYYGTQRRRVETKGVAVQKNGTQEQFTTHHYDVHGRLVKDDEEAIGSLTRYMYDHAARLLLVRGTSTNQSRKFEYDGRGFLVSETPPEMAGLQIFYDDIDSRGNAHGRRYGAESPAFDLRLQFDDAERVTAVFNNNKPIKTFGYLDGRLISAGRVNVIPQAFAENLPEREHAIRTGLTYDDQGRLRTKTVQGGGISLTTTFTYNQLGLIDTLTYPACADGPCSTAGPARVLTYGYVGAALNSISGFVSNVDYHKNGLWSRVDRSNATWDEQGIQDDYARPSFLRTKRPCQTGTCLNFNTGAIWYDGLGNVKAIGGERYAYDGVGRLKLASIGTTEQQFDYDANGNMSRMYTRDPNGVQTTMFTTTGATNRLATINGVSIDPDPAAGDQSHDRAGNLRYWADPRRPGYVMDLKFDPFNLIKQAKLTKTSTPSRVEFGRLHLYDASDERVATIDYVNRGTGAPVLKQTWFYRGAGNEVLREVIREKHDIGSGLTRWRLRWGRDYVYRGSALTAEIVPPPAPTPTPNNPGPTVPMEPQTKRHIHLDHLGTVRLITGNDGGMAEQRRYLPFGEQVVSNIPDSRRAFAGHERDDDQLPGSYGDLDYMHARYYSPMMGRFLSLDSVQGEPGRPQRWNRYAYVMNRPVSAVDPDGRDEWFLLENAPKTEAELTELASVTKLIAPLAFSTTGAGDAFDLYDVVSDVKSGSVGWRTLASLLPWVPTKAFRAFGDLVPLINGRFPVNYDFAGKIMPFSAGLAAKYGVGGIHFTTQGFPIFNQFALKSHVFKVGQLTGNYAKDAAKANKAVGLKRTPDGYVWHHSEDGVTMLLIPRDVHRAARHTGGASRIKAGN